MKTKIVDQSNDRKYFTVIPNIVLDMGLSPYTVTLYIYIKRVAGDDGYCWQTLQTMAKQCKMSKTSVIKSKSELQSAGLIEIEQRESKVGRPAHIIKVLDVWESNTKKYKRRPKQLEVLT